jgi:hypothetical protein
MHMTSLLSSLVAFLVAPGISLKHSLCLTGYSMFAWNVALLGSHVLDVYSSLLHIPPKYSLVLFGIPCAIAQVSRSFLPSLPHETLRLVSSRLSSRQ